MLKLRILDLCVSCILNNLISISRYSWRHRSRMHILGINYFSEITNFKNVFLNSYKFVMLGIFKDFKNVKNTRIFTNCVTPSNECSIYGWSILVFSRARILHANYTVALRRCSHLFSGNCVPDYATHWRGEPPEIGRNIPSPLPLDLILSLPTHLISFHWSSTRRHCIQWRAASRKIRATIRYKTVDVKEQYSTTASTNNLAFHKTPAQI